MYLRSSVRLKVKTKGAYISGINITQIHTSYLSRYILFPLKYTFPYTLTGIQKGGNIKEGVRLINEVLYVFIVNIV